jgi:FMN phosphatase YigB (HAD superfamily)
MTLTNGIVFLFDVDNTLFDNDRFQQDLKDHVRASLGDRALARFWEVFEALWKEGGFADYLGAIQRFRLEEPHNAKILDLGSWTLDYPFASLLYPGAVDAVRHARNFGAVALLTDGDAVFQPRKVERSGLRREVDDQVFLYVHKQKELATVESLLPSRHYVLIDDKVAILDATKAYWGERVTTVFPRQGHYALDRKLVDAYSPPDVTIEAIADFLARPASTWTASGGVSLPSK